MAARIRTVLFGGSFNPIHEGHLALGDLVISRNLADECWFVVSPKNPLKSTADPEDADVRLEAVRLALQGHTGCFASGLEFSLPQPNYSAETLRTARKLFPEREFLLLIGCDNLDVFTQWKDYEFLLETTDILVYPRPGATNRVPEGWNRVRLLDAPLLDISSTQLREAAKKT